MAAPDDQTPNPRAREDDDMSDDPSGWHLDKRVPIAFIVAIVMQTAIAGAIIGRLDERVNNLEENDDRAADDNVGERLAVVESRLSNLTATNARIEGKVDKLIDRDNGP